MKSMWRDADAEVIGRFEAVSEAEMFDVEYWPPEQAKLGRAAGDDGGNIGAAPR